MRSKNLIERKVKKTLKNRPLEEDLMSYKDLNVYRKNEIHDKHLRDSKGILVKCQFFQTLILVYVVCVIENVFFVLFLILKCTQIKKNILP